MRHDPGLRITPAAFRRRNGWTARLALAAGLAALILIPGRLALAFLQELLT